VTLGRSDGPAFERFRLQDLRQWHIVEAVCLACRRRETIPQARLRRSAAAGDRLADLERRLRCRTCGRRGHRLTIRMAPRNT
jgi:hypothetical protein